MKKYIILNLLVCLSFLFGCDSESLLEPDITDYSIIQGDTVKTRKAQLPTFNFTNVNYYVPWVTQWFLIPLLGD